jgi:hypothetical protein
LEKMATSHQGYLDGNHGKPAVDDAKSYRRGYEAGVEDRERGIYYPDYSKGLSHKAGEWVWLRSGAMVEERRRQTPSRIRWRTIGHRIKIKAIVPEIPGYIDEHGEFVRPRAAQICWRGTKGLHFYVAFSEVYNPPPDLAAEA